MKSSGLLFLPMLLMASALEAQESVAPVVDQPLYLEQADIAVREGRLTQAGQMITWLEQNGDKVSGDDIALLRAEHAIANTNVTAAAAALSGIKDPERNICRVQTAKGWVAANAQAVDEAILALAKAARACPDDAGIWNLLGLAFIRKGEAVAAAEAFGQALGLAPDNADILNNHALALLQNGELERALQQLEIAAHKAPDNRMISANADYVSGMLGHMPVRRPQSSDAEWSARLVNSAKGAKAASRTPQANALFSRALLMLDHFDEKLWSEIAPAKEAHN